MAKKNAPEMYAIFKDIFAKMPYLSIELYSADDDILMGKDYKIALPANSYQNDHLFIIPLLNFDGSFTAATPGTNESVQVYSFDVDPEELAEIGHVKFAVVKKEYRPMLQPIMQKRRRSSRRRFCMTSYIMPG